MTRTLRYLLLVVFTGLSGSVFSQEIAGRILDNKKEPLPSAVVQVTQGGIVKGGAAADYDGNYSIKPLEPGYYDVMVLYAGLDTFLTTGVLVSPNQRTTVNATMVRGSKVLAVTTIKAYKKPIIDMDKPASNIMTKTEIEETPTNQIADLVSLSPGVYQQQRGGASFIGGARSTGTTYIIDGVVVQGQTNVDMSQGSIDQIEVITSGIPANYGDVSGGIVNLTTRGVSQKFTGDLRAQHSIDGYNNNLLSFSVAGPIFKKKVDSVHKKPVFGFSLSGDYYYDNDRYPSYDEQYVLKSNVLKNLQANPLRIVSDNSGNAVYNYASDYVTFNDMQQKKISPNDVIKEGRLNGKLDYQVTDNVHLVAGGNVDYTSADQYNRFYEIFSPSSTPVQNTFSGRGFLRFTQKFSKSTDTSHGLISNAYYSVQADYQKLYQSSQDPTFKHNIFEYAYVGQFNKNEVKQYQAGGFDSATGKVATVLVQTVDEGITYNRSNLNPYLANYTTEYYNSLNGTLPTQTTQIQANNALINGDEPNYTYGMFSSPGTTQSYYSMFNSNQYALTVDASFDLQVGKTKHAIEFGLYYQQRVERSYSASQTYNGVGTQSLWSTMRSLVSSVDNGNLVLDKTNPLYRINNNNYTPAQVAAMGIKPGPTDTIVYNYKNIGSGQNNNLGTTFDQNLRKKLGITNPDQDINIDQYSPNTYSLNLFSADELLNSGNPFVSYSGYTYTGGTQTGNVNFNDFWTQKDASGNYTRPIAPFSPNYIAGYLLDKFVYKDVHFNIGVRVDRYSANTKVLIDPYSEYAEKTLNEVSGATNITNNGVHPANLPANSVVYVDDNSATTPTIVGYRVGNNWYDPKGTYVEDPSVLKQYTGGRDPQPVIVKDLNNGTNYSKITDATYNPNSAFTDYTPQVTFQPRVQFNFPISDVANFYGHYDVYSQRPTTGVAATAYDYYYLNQNSNTIISNPNLKPEQTIDYEVGFQQKLSDHSGLTLSAYYKERKNQIAIQPYLYAFPTTYYTFGNRDFSTTKGTTIKYDLRATNHISMTLSYTLQFAEGTGSTPYSTNSGQSGQITPNGLLQSFIEAGLPNLRYVSALDYDSRHNIVANINYRYADGEGPIVDGLNILQNAGIDLIGKARSGEPYTRLENAQGGTVVGGVNGSRLPWHYGLDLRIDKDFALTSGKKRKDALEGVRPRKPLYIKAIVQVNNLLNTRDILAVYGYTGKPNDNGYLTSPYGLQYVPQQVNPVSYSDLYMISENNPGNLNYARTISFALQFDF
jgi:hypothetical protein